MSDGWRIEDHLCRVCFGRLLSRVDDDGQRQFRCSNCGAEGEGRSASVLCACGMRSSRGTDLGIRCVHNDQVSPEVPGQIVARALALAKGS